MSKILDYIAYTIVYLLIGIFVMGMGTIFYQAVQDDPLIVMGVSAGTICVWACMRCAERPPPPFR